MQEVRTTTKSVFKDYAADNSKFAKCITALSKLKGIGPATASLLLSCYDPVKVPFFSDELFRYLHWSDAKSKGWDRKISYTMKEYKDLFEKVQVLRRRLEKESGQVVKAIDIEKCAYALAKGAQQYHESGGMDDRDDQALFPPSPKRRKRASPEPHEPTPIEVCLRKGPGGSPTFDEMGFELDYDYISKGRGRPRPLGKRALAKLDKKREESEQKKKIMGAEKDQVTSTAEPAWDDRVARDLGIAYHEVGMEEYEEWQRRGFHAEPGEFQNPSQKEKDRLMRLSTGCALRKGSKHR